MTFRKTLPTNIIVQSYILAGSIKLWTVRQAGNTPFFVLRFTVTSDWAFKLHLSVLGHRV